MESAKKYLHGVIEAALFVALSTTPVFFNHYTSRVFDPDKVTLFRTIMTLAISAALVRLVAQVLSGENLRLSPWWSKALRHPLLLATGATFASAVISTVFSISPRISVWGAYLRLQGLYTTICYLALFAITASMIRSKSRIELIIILLNAASIPVALAALAQKLDPQPALWSSNSVHRVISTIGNPIFLGAYMAMVSPLSIVRILQFLFPQKQVRNHGPRHLAKLALWTATAGMQVFVLLLTQSRGPFLGWLASMGLVGALWFGRIRMRRAAVVCLLMPVVLVALFIAVPDRLLPGRYRHILDNEHRNTKTRLWIWQSTLELLERNPQIGCSNDTMDPYTAIRPLIGYGPDALMTVFGKAYRSELNRYEDIRLKIPDRAHNQTWNFLAESGLIGVAAYLFLVGVILFTGASALRLAKERASALFLLVCIFTGAAICGAFFAAWGGAIFLGPAVPLGMVGGLFAFVGYKLLAAAPDDQTSEESIIAGSPTLVPVFSALVCHIVESQFGIGTSTNISVFWVLLAILAVETLQTDDSAVTDDQEESSNGRAFLIWGMTAGFSLAALAHGQITNIKMLASAWSIIRHVAESSSGLVIGLSFAFWILFALFLQRPSTTLSDKSANISLAASAAAAITAGFLCLQLPNLAWLARFVPQTIAEVLKREVRLEVAGLMPHLLISAGVLVMGASAFYPFRSLSLLSFLSAMAAAIVTLLVAAPPVYGPNIRAVQADVCAKTIDGYSMIKKTAHEFALHSRLFHLNAAEPNYHTDVSRSLFDLCRSTNDIATIEHLLPEAEQHLITARFLNPFYYEHTFNLASLYAWWAIKTKGKVIRKARADLAEIYFQQALRLSAQNPNIWASRAILHANALDNPNAAAAMFRKAIALDPDNAFTHKLAGDFYDRLRPTGAETNMVLSVKKLAVYHYEKAVALATRNAPFDPALCRVTLARLYHELGEKKRSLECAIAAYPFLNKKNKEIIKTFVEESKPPPADEQKGESTEE